ncbi:hypothetical protein KUV80_06545 [Fictibacillus nanhaiensis]|uniref:hypothetical protein n=1 Tax=Fictibacillus nanhaiensis TaxID=742169 RepID=UPI001C966166|nr:hypothetical protein [Fictibacillus nanhaiensis]MBY6036302.1 hypothetical protein [Fictibacillus nanhaiensis]
MGSLFNHGSCCGNTHGKKELKCKGCVCELLNDLVNTADLCRLGEPTLIRVIPKGADEPLDVNGSDYGTEFTLVRFDPETCCVVLSYYTGVRPSGYTQTVVLDCRCLCGVICVNEPPGRRGV